MYLQKSKLIVLGHFVKKLKDLYF